MQMDPLEAFRRLDLVMYGALGETHSEPPFGVTRCDAHRSFRLANALFVATTSVSLEECEAAFSRWFLASEACHRCFVFYSEKDDLPVAQEARRRRFREVNRYPIRLKAVGAAPPPPEAEYLARKLVSDADWELLRGFLARCYPRNAWARTELPRILQDQAACERIERFCFETQDGVVASLGLIEDGAFVRLENVIVRPDLRRQGWGGRLLRFAHWRAGRHGAQQLILTAAPTPAANRLYNSYGFRVVGHKFELMDY